LSHANRRISAISLRPAWRAPHVPLVYLSRKQNTAVSVTPRARNTEAIVTHYLSPPEAAVAAVSRISVAPVKALALVHPDEVQVDLDGVRGDRRFLLVDERRRLVNGKRFGELALITPCWDEHTRELALRFPSGETVCSIVNIGSPSHFSHGSMTVAAREVVGPWAAALSDYLRRRVMLLWTDSGYPDRAVRGGSISIVSYESITRLQSELRVAAPIDSRRFRMTFDIAGAPRAHAEDDWLGRYIRIGGAAFEPLGHVGRCVVTCRDPATGQRDLDTLGALARYRLAGRSEPLSFGIYCRVAASGRVRLGDGLNLDCEP